MKATFGALLLAASLLVAAPAYADPAVLTVWVSAAGSDSNDGTRASPVKTLARVQQILRTAAPDADVEVRIDQGTYLAGTTSWDHYIPGHFITFLPADYEIGGNVDSFAGRPVFRSNGQPGYWFVAKVPAGHTGGNVMSRLRFYYLQVEYYGQGGILFAGETQDVDGFRVPTVGLNGNYVYGMKFEHLGSVWGNGVGYGGVSPLNSSGNTIANNHFRYLENVSPQEAAVHGIYALHGSDNNVVRNNSFYVVSGHPMRVRNQSNGNNVYANTFTGTGGAAYSEWFCDPACQAANPGAPLECASSGNVFHNNTLVSRYGGGTLLEYWLYPAGMTNPGPDGCPALPGPRVTTYGNS